MDRLRRVALGPHWVQRWIYRAFGGFADAGSIGRGRS